MKIFWSSNKFFVLSAIHVRGKSNQRALLPLVHYLFVNNFPSDVYAWRADESSPSLATQAEKLVALTTIF